MITQALLTPVDEIPYIWHEVKPLIDKALVHSNGEILSEDILNYLLSKEQYLFVGLNNERAIHSALVGEVIDYPRKRVFRVITWSTKSGRGYNDWVPLLSSIEYFAKQAECNSIEAWARKGLAKKLKWDNEYSVITKNI